MGTCPVCHATLVDGKTRCLSCGRSLTSRIEKSLPASVSPLPETVASVGRRAPTDSEKRRAELIGNIVFGLCYGVIGIVFMIFLSRRFILNGSDTGVLWIVIVVLGLSGGFIYGIVEANKKTDKRRKADG